MAASQKVSFTVRRPTPVSRAASSDPDSDIPSFKVPPLPRHLVQSAESAPGSPLARSEADSPYTNGYEDSSDEDDATQDELVTGFDRFGVQRLHEDRNRKKQEPLVIPALKNKDWRELARKRRNAQQYVPISTKVQTGTDGSVGGLGTRDVIGSGPVLSGLQLHKKAVKIETEEGTTRQELTEDVKMEEAKEEGVELSEDESARRAILAEASGTVAEEPSIDAIPTPISEEDAYKQDVEELPDTASLEDYARVPVEQFGAAMLRGMGWREGTAASKNGKGPVQPYLPAARPALLGIGAKEMEVFDDGSKKKGPIRPERKYVPVIKREREQEDTPVFGFLMSDSKWNHEDF
ncbi:Pre-mRNA-splicing factor spp2 [Leucoagaricus sp. SymC.cos]|nr:Pre-mRNA-splicing factor spp2 [Leucoagaricus sp. SymC.cos]